MNLTAQWLRAFLLTEAIEIPLAVRWLPPGDVPLARRLGLAAFASLATHPAVWFLFPLLPLSYNTSVALSELFAWSMESVYYFLTFPRAGWVRATAVSALANGASFGVGLLLYEWKIF